VSEVHKKFVKNPVNWLLTSAGRLLTSVNWMLIISYLAADPSYLAAVTQLTGCRPLATWLQSASSWLMIPSYLVANPQLPGC
jgi:hypothetical protein